MTINERIQSALKFRRPVDPVEPDVYTGEKDTYFTYNYTVMPTDYGDDAPSHERYLVQVHFCCPLGFNSLKIRKRARLALYKAGFTYPAEVNATDRDGQHFIFECETAEGTELT